MRKLVYLFLLVVLVGCKASRSMVKNETITSKEQVNLITRDSTVWHIDTSYTTEVIKNYETITIQNVDSSYEFWDNWVKEFTDSAGNKVTETHQTGNRISTNQQTSNNTKWLEDSLVWWKNQSEGWQTAYTNLQKEKTDSVQESVKNETKSSSRFDSWACFISFIIGLLIGAYAVVAICASKNLFKK